MRLRKEDFFQIDRILELFLKEEIGNFVSYDIARILSIDNDYASFLRDTIRGMNEELSFFSFDIKDSGNLYVVGDNKFLIRRFLEDGGMEAYYLSQSLDTNDLALLHHKIDLLTTGNVSLLEGQKELDEAIRSGFSDFEAKLYGLKRSDLPELIRAQTVAAVIGLAINPENLEAVISVVQNQLL